MTGYFKTVTQFSRVSSRDTGCMRACCAKLLQSHLTLCDPMDCSPPGSSDHGILQARILEWFVMPSLKGSFLPQGSNPCLYILLNFCCCCCYCVLYQWNYYFSLSIETKQDPVEPSQLQILLVPPVSCL